jgi:signal transduction histidine kinase/ActR/RegA family two-component response regulator
MSPEEYRQLWETISGGNVWEGEFHNKTKEGKSFWEKATIAPIFNEKKEIINYLAVKKDITEQKALEAQLRQSQKMEAIGLLAGGVAHDFNNLLTIINGYSGIILADTDQSNPVFEKVKQIMAAGERAASLTRQLLAFSRKQVMRPEIIDINMLVTRMESLLRRLIGEDIDLVMLYSDHLNPVKADPGQIEQVIMNLVVNARDAMPAGGCLTFESKNIFLDKSHAGIYPEAKSGEYAMFSITDTGEGMDAETCDHIFDPFFTTKEVGKGTGLGLSTVYGIIRQSKGVIRVFSEPGQGTTFEILLPISESAEFMQKQSAASQSTGGSEVILVVEDEESVRNLTVLALTRQGYQVLHAENGVEALQIIEKNAGRIQLVMTDVVMPQMGGLELAEKIITMYPQIRLVFISGYTDRLAISQGVQGKKIDFIQKPFSMHQLAQKVRESLDQQ